MTCRDGGWTLVEVQRCPLKTTLLKELRRVGYDMRGLFRKVDGLQEVRRLPRALETAYREKKIVVQNLEETIQALKVVCAERVDEYQRDLGKAAQQNEALEQRCQKLEESELRMKQDLGKEEKEIKDLKKMQLEEAKKALALDN